MKHVVIRKEAIEEKKQEQELHRPYIRKEVREQVEANAEKNEKGQFLDANTKEPIDGQYDLGHKPDHEFWREKERAESEGLSQEEFNEKMNDPDLYQIEDPHNNRSHQYEKPREVTSESKGESNVESNEEENCDSM